MKMWIIKSQQEFCWEIQSEPKAEGLWREFVAEYFFVVIFISSASWAQPEHLDLVIMSNCAQIVFRPQESLYTVAWVSLFRLTLPVRFSLCCTPTLSTFFSLSLTLMHMQVSFCSLLLYLTNTHCTRPPAAAEPTLHPRLSSSPIPSSPAGLSLLLHSACTHHLTLCGPAPAGSSGSICAPACCDSDLRLRPDCGRKRNEYNHSELYVSEDVTWPAYCPLFLFCWLL